MRVRVPTALACLALAAGCATQPATATGTEPAGATLRVGLNEWRILISGPEVTPGIDHFVVTNAGTTAHDLHVTGPGVHVHSALLRPGRATTLIVTARPGSRLTLTCEEPGHERAGMHTTVLVTG